MCKCVGPFLAIMFAAGMTIERTKTKRHSPIRCCSNCIGYRQEIECVAIRSGASCSIQRCRILYCSDFGFVLRPSPLQLLVSIAASSGERDWTVAKSRVTAHNLPRVLCGCCTVVNGIRSVRVYYKNASKYSRLLFKKKTQSKRSLTESVENANGECDPKLVGIECQPSTHTHSVRTRRPNNEMGKSNVFLIPIFCSSRSLFRSQ